MAGMGGLVGKGCIAWLADAGRNYAKWLAAGLLALIVALGVSALCALALPASGK
jgi:hypothetical protein